MWLLDTNVLSGLRRADRLDLHLAAWAKNLNPQEVFLSAITILEIEIGALRVMRRDINHGSILRSWIDEHVLPSFANRILPVDTAVALRAAALHVPDPRSDRNTLIAATALEHRLRVATRNEMDFRYSGVDIFNPWRG